MRRITANEVAPVRRDPVDADTLARAATIVADVRAGGLRRWAEQLGDIQPGAPLVLGPEVLARALAELDPAARGVLERTADRIRTFALAQRASLSACATTITSAA
jgi:phosphoribosyl-ATP pyrophosphohydrolase/phosphoribosyl-AMP cyclohydrolase/histidinol dehydrogenase